ncbi:MAG: TonB-dependent receptor [Bacteroidia bacterium]
MKTLQITIVVAFLHSFAFAATIKGVLKDKANGQPLFGAVAYIGKVGSYTDNEGNYRLDDIEPGTHTLYFRMFGYNRDSMVVTVSKAGEVFNAGVKELSMSEQMVKDGVVISDYYSNRPSRRMADIEGLTINAGKKTDAVVIGQIDANVAVNTSRQIFARVPGITLWENDGTGTGVSISARGLSPNRSWEFNTRQNGYDIAADPLGYPEAYYSPAIEGVERVEIVRGAASLQYGPQFGGMVNYRMKRGAEDRKFSAEAALTGGSFGMMNGFGSVGGQIGKLNYYGFYNYRQADGWRENTAYFNHAGYTAVEYQATEKMKIGLQFTGLNYLLQQPGGLTDAQFADNPRQSVRERNWFALRWNMPAMTIDYDFSPDIKSRLTAYSIIGERSSVGYTSSPNTADNNGVRRVDIDHYKNIGAEWRTIFQYKFIGKKKSALAAGVRYFNGYTNRLQGNGTIGSNADFSFADPANLARDLDLRSENIAVFAENIFYVGEKLKIVPGVRYEFIRISAEGIPAVKKETRENTVFLAGSGFEYALPFGIIIYGNWAQAYRPITFNDIWTNNISTVIDPEIKPATGWNSDLGVRGSIKNGLYYDINAFYLVIEGRVGELVLTDTAGNAYNFRTNTGNSLNKGLEAYIDIHPFQLMNKKAKIGDVGIFASAGYLDAYYTEGSNKDKRVEYTPEWTVRSGITWQYKMISTTFNWSYVDGVFSDAKNTVFAASGTTGWISHYNVLDWSFTVKLPRNFTVKGSLNNITDNRYYTRRSGGYPGPGILPSDARNFALTLGMKF